MKTSLTSGSPRSASPFWSRARCVLVGIAFVVPAGAQMLLGAACSATDSGGAAAGGGGTGSEETISAVGSGVGGNDADATVPDAQPDVTPPDYRDLCGDGECSPGPDDGCGEGGGFAGLAGMEHRDDHGPLGCHVVADDEGEPTTTCAPAGTGALDAPCQSSVDCTPGSACVPTEQTKNQAAAGICRPYCCGDLEACAEGSFCAPRFLVEDASLDVPVCVAVSRCELLEEGACPPGTTCSVVRADGTTSCVVPGGGELCEPCPCAAGFVCAVHTGLCQKLCRTDGPEDECGGGLCQGGSSDYPAGIGVCVGGAEEACSDP